MRKIIAVLSVLMCFASMNMFAQEVRGIETRRVIYDGPEYFYVSEKNTKYYGWEFTNRNSFTVSVDISLWAQARSNGYTTTPSQVVKTQSIILNSGETYIFKREEHCSTKVKSSYCDWSISDYHIEYKAYKLQ